jgi:hypothetical protein
VLRAFLVGTTKKADAFGLFVYPNSIVLLIKFSFVTIVTIANRFTTIPALCPSLLLLTSAAAHRTTTVTFTGA